jgi:hypothetical protein
LWNSVISGTCQEILDELYAAHKAGTISLSGDFPATAAELGFELKKWENQLRANGLQITRSRTATARICTIRNCN